MNHKVAGEDMGIISSLLKEWAKSKSISELDYDILTGKIKSLYEMVKFSAPDICNTKDSETAFESEDVNIVKSIYDAECCITEALRNEGYNYAHPEAQKKVLGDVIRPCGETIADRLGNTVKDVGMVLGNEKITSLHRAIGFNDKYLILRDLFDGDIDAYESAITHLDEFTSIDDAMLYINDTFDWSSENAAAHMISDMLVRKLM